MHAFLVLYSVWAGATRPLWESNMTFIQEVKINIFTEDTKEKLQI